MAEAPPLSAVTGPTDVDLAAALEQLSPALSDAVAAALRERDELVLLRDTLLDAEQAPSLESRLRAIAGGVQRLGYRTAAIVLVSASGASEFVITAESAPANTEDMVTRARPIDWDSLPDDDAPAVALPLAAPNARARCTSPMPPRPTRPSSA